MKLKYLLIFITTLFFTMIVKSQEFKLNSLGYFQNHGIDIMAFDDIYPEGHQGGLAIIMNGDRVATNGDIRLEISPGQWQPLPIQKSRHVDQKNNRITVELNYPDTSRHLKGFNPMVYPDLEFNYTVNITGESNSIVVSVDLDRPIPEDFIGKVGFNFELFPGKFFGKSWMMDDQNGIFPLQPNGPTQLIGGKLNSDYEYNPIEADRIVAQPYSEGKRLVLAAEDPHSMLTIESDGNELKLYDGRMNHNNGWFVVRSEVPAGKTDEAIKWIITPNVVSDWMYRPVIQTSQVGYLPNASKVAVIELDKRDQDRLEPKLYQITSDGDKLIYTTETTNWGTFLRYNYLKFDFSHIKEEGLYKICYGNSESSVFRINNDVYDRGVWQPVLEYFLPVQMCHMRVNEKYRIWHDLCHMDDAKMAPIDHNHFDGYLQGSSTLTKYEPGEIVPGLNIGGWHDAGDYDLRVESQSAESYILALTYEEFHPEYDETSINHQTRITEIHQPDGKPDILQQVENGVLTVVAGYNTLGRLYRGIICNNLRQYVMLGDAGAMTNNIIGDKDDRWVFTEDNPPRELSTAADLAASSRVLRNFNDTLSIQALDIAKELFHNTNGEGRAKEAKLRAATELYLATGNNDYKDFLISNIDYITNNINRVGWFIGRADVKMNNIEFSEAVQKALLTYRNELELEKKETPYGIPYRPKIWGAGWDIQSFGVKHYFLTKTYPEIFSSDIVFNSLNFILGCHPGKNTSSFASGVGTKSATVAYGVNRADWSFIPGGVVSGTALIRPDFPEFLEFPFLWQQTEYVMGGGSSNYMFLVLAALELSKNE
ncbi:MAG: glycoside hydrolase family 9 protein [Dysgonamonadaceae bacterium]|nr:glycoside hydrolase family 9 protein [Dysgonamonadaceae bacterium]MDD3355349.1 glycoside hydrolase family 9 protein [Dysgonamonadaceae bacterium]MDD3726712.1 glycoside hydrolase family 9 protein [Dysgonamonadaceae bacterium]MDD4246045.1 glycoside hydrolase family 9 protein [Dysgonamonadaceae bacterium]MDD4604948.1 glycoside hydrolase family 9 protein [Dysgonamonadaceae bacterium]